MKIYEPGKTFECEIKGEAKELKDFGYPIPNEAQNQYELEKLFTRQTEVDERVRRKNYDDKDISMDTVSNIPILHVSSRRRREKRMVTGIFKYSVMDNIHDSNKTMGVDTIKRSYGHYKSKKLL